MKIAAYIVALVVALAYGCNQHQASDDSKESPLAAARAANEEIQLAMAESKCGDSEGPQGLCRHLKQAQADIDKEVAPFVRTVFSIFKWNAGRSRCRFNRGQHREIGFIRGLVRQT